MVEREALHVVLGSGQIGARLVELLLARGHRVRAVRQRASDAPPREGLERVHGDIRDAAFAESSARGATVVYDCLNPPYHRWPELLIPLARGALHAARTAGAKLVALDNLYAYGRPNGPMNEDTPIAP